VKGLQGSDKGWVVAFDSFCKNIKMEGATNLMTILLT
jgi:hypothetical protein